MKLRFVIGFIVPLFCFAFVAFYGFNWPRFSKVEGKLGPHLNRGPSYTNGHK